MHFICEHPTQSLDKIVLRVVALHRNSISGQLEGAHGRKQVPLENMYVNLRINPGFDVVPLHDSDRAATTLDYDGNLSFVGAPDEL